MKLTIIRGVPGSGKTTYAHENFQCLILENDMFQIIDGKYFWSSEGTKHAIALVKQMAEMALANGSDVCIANTFTKRRYIESFKRLAELNGAEFEVIRCTGKFMNVHNVPAFVLDNMKNSFEDWPGEKVVSIESTL